MDINKWISNIIEGTAGFKVCEEREIMIHHISRIHSVSAWTIRCLANPECEGSKEVLDSIIKQRNEGSK